MIIVGYPGIGKSSVVKQMNNVIDLESSNFDKWGDWVPSYVKTARDLSKQGYIVLVSCHEAVRSAFGDLAWVIYPAEGLWGDWCKRLMDRYIADSSLKNKNALIRCLEHGKDDLKELELAHSYGNYVRIDNIDYDLKDYIVNCYASENNVGVDEAYKLLVK